MIFSSTDPATQEWANNPEVYAKATGNTPAPVMRRAHRPNRILVAWRERGSHDPYDMLMDLQSAWSDRFTRAEVEHAESVIEKWIGFKRSIRQH